MDFCEKSELWDFGKHPGAKRVAADMAAIIGKAQQGILIETPYVAYPKDEVVDPAKIHGSDDETKTRSFFAGDMASALAFRKYFQSFYSRLTETHMLHPIKIGISAKGGGWEDLYFSLASISPVGWCADAKDWDARMPKMFMEECCVCINAVYEATNPHHQERDSTARTTLHKNVESALIILLGDVIRFLNGGQVSGFPGTAPENSLIHWALSFLVYEDLALKTNMERYRNYKSYRKYVGAAFYGDDSVQAVAKEVQPFFTLPGFIEESAKYGFKFTPADKSSVASAEFTPIAEMDFLKRGFSKLDGSIVGALNLKSLGKHLEWIQDSPAYAITEEDGEYIFPRSRSDLLIKDSLETLWSELALHGPEEYLRWKRHILAQEKILKVGIVVPTYRDALQLGGVFGDN
jgi:hypothetical protein